MNTTKTQGPFCQSCGMPLGKPEDFGTMREGIRSNEYCHFCFADGAFTNPTMAMSEMTDLCTRELAKTGMPATEARALMTRTLPLLKRWRTAVPVS